MYVAVEALLYLRKDTLHIYVPQAVVLAALLLWQAAQGSCNQISDVRK